MMDSFLKNVLENTKLKDGAKRHVIMHMVNSIAGNPIDVQSCKTLLEFSGSLAITSEKDLDKEIGLKIFHTWASNNNGTLTEWFYEKDLKALLSEQYTARNKISLFQLLLFILEHLDPSDFQFKSSLTVISQYLGPLIEEAICLESMVAATLLLEKLPLGLGTAHFCLCLVRKLASLDVNTSLQEGVKKDIDTICLYLKSVLLYDGELMKNILSTILGFLSTEESVCSFAIAGVVEVCDIAETHIEKYCQHVIDQVTSDDAQVIVILSRMFKWLSWPEARMSASWILHMLETCQRNDLGWIFRTVFEDSIKIVLSAMLQPNTREAALKVFRYMASSGHFTPVVSPKRNEAMQILLSKHPGLIVPDDLGNKSLAGASLPNGRPTTLTGLDNLGNTCFINSVVQALNMTYSFRQKILQSAYRSQHSVLGELQKTLAFLLLTQRPSYSPDKFVRISRPTWFTDGEQQDSQEYLNYLFDRLATEQKGIDRRTDSVQEVFGGTAETGNTCGFCKKTSSMVDTFSSLLLPLPVQEPDVKSAISLDEMLTSYFKPEYLQGGNKYFCSHCNELQDAERKIHIRVAPQHLLITLLRFEYNSESRRKLSTPVIFPKELDFPIEESVGVQTLVQYFLYAVVFHSGMTADKGHYYTYARCSASQVGSEEVVDSWYFFNDDKVSRTSFEVLEKVSLKNSKETAYMLFYCRSSQEILPSLSSLVNQELKEDVLIDNLKFLKDQERATKSKRSRKPPNHLNRRDENNDDQPPSGGGCGLGGGFGGLDSPSRMIF